MSLSMDLLKKLRDSSLAPLGDCKAALTEADGDLEKAKIILKEKGILKAGKKADRETNEGLVKAVNSDSWTAGIKLLCETDFVAKNDMFIELLDVLANKLLTVKKNVNSVSELDPVFLGEMNAIAAEFSGKIGENVKVGDAVVLGENAYVYNHPGNKVATIICYEGEPVEVAKELALQVTAMDPTYLDVDSVPEEYRKEIESQIGKDLVDSGKPKDIIDQILKGRMSKALAEVVLLEQEYIRDASKKIKDIVPASFKTKRYIRIAI